MRLLISLLALTALAATSAQAQSRRELDERLRAAEAAIAQMQADQQGGDPAVIRLLERVDSLERQVADLTSQVEEARFENRQLRRNYETLQEDMFSLLNASVLDENGEPVEGAQLAVDPALNRAARSEFGDGDGGPVSLTDPNQDVAIVNPDDPNAEAKRAATRPLGAEVAPARQFDADPDFIFAQAQTRLNEGAFISARENYQRFLELSPDDRRAGEAHFWVGRVQMIEDRPAAAAQSFIAAMERDGPKAPEAMIQLALALDSLGQTSEACRTLSAAPREFPDAGTGFQRALNDARSETGCS